MERIHGPCGRPKEQAASDFLSFYQALPQHDISLFSDGSQLDNKRTGAGFVGYQAGLQVLYGSSL
jgi:hypothetical protein